MLSCFQFLGIPPKGEPKPVVEPPKLVVREFPISRDPPEGGTHLKMLLRLTKRLLVSNF